jgi:8-amino-7-oxononanoate synthase
MDGCLARLPDLAAIKKKHGCFLMIDEAHSLGVVGRAGRGVAEHFALPPSSVGVWMGTLSKTLAGCGGFIAGSADLVEYLKFTAPGFVYSVGLSPPLAAASRAALAVLEREPERVARLSTLGTYFVEGARRRGLDIGTAGGYAIVPVIVGNSLVAGYLATALFARGINVQPIIHPVVEEGAARLRFFLSSAHREDQIDRALDLVVEELPAARKRAEDFVSQ